jgi:predicted ATPase
MRSDLPSGTVTFLFTDVEGSTQLLHELGAEGYADALAEHRRVIRTACTSEGGVEVDTQGDAFFFAFPTAPGALSAAGSFTETLASGPIRVRVGLHTGTPLVTEEGYVGQDVHRAARIAAAGHAGQVLVSASTAQLVEIELRDLGEHRLKDLSAPERIYQLADGEFPSLKTLYRTNLPVPATPFLGREAELAEVVELLTGDGLHLLTLTGPGGTGKTRLALQAAAEASESFPDGVFWVPLAPLRDPELVLPSLARTLAVSEEPGTPLEDTLAAHLSGKRLLLLLDNVEHLLPPAAERIAALRATNGSQLLVTSRERLRIGGEQTWPVPPLAEEDGTALFIARARAVDPTFTPSPTVDELCARLDELPLAIELAAARTAVFSAEQLLERLSQRLDLLRGDRDADPRQQTLRATIEWSHDLLTEDEQRLFARLAVFVGGCTYEAAEEVTGADPDTLQSLLDKSLLRKRATELGPRYWMLETIREFAAGRLEDSGEVDELRGRHAEWFLALADEAYPKLLGDPRPWLDRLDAEHDNFRAALDHLATVQATQMALQLAGALARYWAIRGHITEGGRRLEAALNADERPTRERGRALNGCAALYGYAGNLGRVRAHSEEALALHRAIGDRWGATYSIYLLGLNAADSGDFDGAEPLLDEALQGFKALDDAHYVLLALDALAWTYGRLGDDERRRLLHEEVLEEARRQGNERVEALTLYQLASLARREGRHDDDVAMLSESLRMYRELQEASGIATTLGEFGKMFALHGDAVIAAKLVAAAQAMGQRIGFDVPWISAMNEETLTAIRAQLDEDAIARAWEEGSLLALDEAVALALGEAEPDA